MEDPWRSNLNWYTVCEMKWSFVALDSLDGLNTIQTDKKGVKASFNTSQQSKIIVYVPQ